MYYFFSYFIISECPVINSAGFSLLTLGNMLIAGLLILILLFGIVYYWSKKRENNTRKYRELSRKNTTKSMKMETTQLTTVDCDEFES